MQFHDFEYSNKINILKNIFNNILSEDLDYLFNHSYFKKYKKGDIVFDRDLNKKYKDDSIYILLDGIIQIGYLSPSGRFHAFNYYSEKNFINLFSCLQDQIPEYDYYAFNQVRVLVIPKTIFLEVLDRNSQFSQQVMHIMASRMHFLMAELKFMHVANLHQRVSKILIHLAQQYGVRHTLGTEIKLKISQHDLSDLLSASRQTVNKEIKKLVLIDVLDWRYENIIIKNYDYLVDQINI